MFQINSAVYNINTRNTFHIIITDQLPKFHVFRKVHTMLVSEHSTEYCVGPQDISENTQLNTHFLYSVDDFMMFKNNSYSYYQVYVTDFM
jgi:hypothetical protein